MEISTFAHASSFEFFVYFRNLPGTETCSFPLSGGNQQVKGIYHAMRSFKEHGDVGSSEDKINQPLFLGTSKGEEAKEGECGAIEA